MRTPEWAVGMRKVGVGVYVDASGYPHLDLAAICVAAGFPPTPENIRIPGEAARELASKQWPATRIVPVP